MRRSHRRRHQATEQIAVRPPVEQLAVLDALAERGVYPTGAAAVSAGIEAVVELGRRREDDRAIPEGYRRVSPNRAEKAAAVPACRRTSSPS